MKQFIVLAAVLPLLFVFLAQYALDQKNNVLFGVLQDQVYTAKEKAKQKGCFTEEIISELREGISTAFEINPDQIEIDATEIPAYRVNSFDERGLIQYRVSVPVNPVMAAGKFFGIGGKENNAVYVVSGSAASELLPGPGFE